MSRPDPKPTALDLTDLLGYKLAWSENQRAAAELAAIESQLMLAKQQHAHTSAQLEQARVMIAQAYELAEGDSFNRIDGAIERAKASPTDSPDVPDVDQGDADDKSPAGPKPNGKQEAAPNVA